VSVADQPALHGVVILWGIRFLWAARFQGWTVACGGFVCGGSASFAYAGGGAALDCSPGTA